MWRASQRRFRLLGCPEDLYRLSRTSLSNPSCRRNKAACEQQPCVGLALGDAQPGAREFNIPSFSHGNEVMRSDRSQQKDTDDTTLTTF